MKFVGSVAVLVVLELFIILALPSFLAIVALLLLGGAALAGAVTPLGMLNYFVLQWFGVRLARVYATELVDHRIVNAWAAPGGGISVAGTAQPGRRVQIGWRLLRWVVPLTGWWTDYRWISRRP